MGFIIKKLIKARAGYTGEGGWAAMPSTFLRSKKKKRNKGTSEMVSKQKLLKDCHQSQNITVLAILELLEFENFSCQPTMVAGNTFQCSMAPRLWNPYRRPWNRCQTCSSYSYHLLGIKLLIKHGLLISWCHGFLLLLKFEVNLSSWGSITYNRSGLT